MDNAINTLTQHLENVSYKPSHQVLTCWKLACHWSISWRFAVHAGCAASHKENSSLDSNLPLHQAAADVASTSQHESACLQQVGFLFQPSYAVSNSLSCV